NGKVLVVGGYYNGSLSSAELYNPVTQVWIGTGSLNYARYAHTATLLPSGKVLVVGGRRTSGGVEDSGELFDPDTEMWSTTGSLLFGRSNHMATRLQDGKVLVSGGYNYDVPLATVELYDPATENWHLVGRLNVARGRHQATLLPNGKVLVVGGDQFGVPVNALNSSELYDPTTSVWTATHNLNAPRSDHTVTMLANGKVLVAGGVNTDSNGNLQYLNSAELHGGDPLVVVSPTSKF